MISINFSGDTMAEVARDAVQFAMIVANSAPPQLPATPQPLDPSSDGSPFRSLPEAAGVETKRTRRSKAQIEADAAAAAVEAAKPVDIVAAAIESTAGKADASETVYPAATFDDAKAALKDVCETNGCGVEAAKDMMASFKITRLSLLEEGSYGRFVQACKDRIGAAK